MGSKGCLKYNRYLKYNGEKTLSDIVKQLQGGIFFEKGPNNVLKIKILMIEIY